MNKNKKLLVIGAPIGIALVIILTYLGFQTITGIQHNSMCNDWNAQVENSKSKVHSMYTQMKQDESELNRQLFPSAEFRQRVIQEIDAYNNQLTAFNTAANDYNFQCMGEVTHYSNNSTSS